MNKSGGIIFGFMRTAGLVAVLVIMQQLIASSIFGLTFDWPAVPLLILVNYGIIAGWYYLKRAEIKLPMFVVVIAAFFFTVWLRAILIFLGVFKLVAPAVIAFVERQFSVLVVYFSTPQFLPAMLAAILLLLILPKAKDAWRRIISTGFVIPPRPFE
jgi:hypothetical protein